MRSIFQFAMKQSLLVLVAVFVLAGSASAQRQSAAFRALPAASRALVVDVDPTQRFRTARLPGGRLDLDARVLRAAYRLQWAGAVLDTPELTARAWMRGAREQFGWDSADDLVLVAEVRTEYSTHLTFQQTYGGVPVHGRTVKVNLGPHGRPTMVFSTYASHLERAARISPTPSVSAREASELARQLIAPQSAQASTPELVVYPRAEPVLAWRVIAWPSGAPGEWEVLLNAQTGKAIHLADRVMRRHDPDSTHAHRRIDGKGMAWIPDPITSAGVPYGGDYTDNNDADSDALNNERVEVSLRDITQGSDGKYRLEGPYVVIDGTAGASYSPPAMAAPDSFVFLRSDQHFEAVQVYYHIDTSQRYVQSLDVGRDIQAGGVAANPHGEGSQDNSAFYPHLNQLRFGDGGVDDGEDAEVIVHEYAHALLYDLAPTISFFGEGAALHEGWADYWAVSYTRGLMEDGTVPSGDWRHVFTWDGNETWSGRRLGSTRTYPDGFSCVDAQGFCDIYDDGLIWATTLMEIYDELGKRRTDQLNLIGYAYLGGGTTFVDAAEALVQADLDRFGGADQNTLLSILGERGFLVREVDALQLATPWGLWDVRPGGGYEATRSGTDEVSTLELLPLVLPFYAGEITLGIAHEYEFGNTSGGNVKISSDDGNTWHVVDPVGGYAGSYDPGVTHTMAGERVFTGSSSQGSVFDLASYAGSIVDIRIDLATAGGLATNESWSITEAALAISTSIEQAALPAAALALSNYPNPFRGRTTLRYDLLGHLPVRLEVYNLLGQRVATLVDRAQAAASYAIPLDLSDHPSGVYFVRLTAGGQQMTKPLMLLR